MTEHTWSDSRVQIGQSGGLDCISETRRHGVVKERANGVRCATKHCVSYRTGRYKREGKILEREGVARKIVGASDGAVGHIGHREGVVCGTRWIDARIHGEASKHRCCDELRQENAFFGCMRLRTCGNGALACRGASSASCRCVGGTG